MLQLHVIIKECAHKCNPYFDPISISYLIIKKSLLDQVPMCGRGRNAKVHVAVDMQLAALTCSITASPSYLRLRNLTLIW